MCGESTVHLPHKALHQNEVHVFPTASKKPPPSPKEVGPIPSCDITSVQWRRLKSLTYTCHIQLLVSIYSESVTAPQ